MIRLEASIKTGYLYHFTGSWESLNDIVNEGLLPSDNGEFSWEQSPRIKKEYEGKYQFASFTRNPSTVTGVYTWTYGIICDAEKLTSKYLMRPYTYWVRPGERRIVVRQGYSGRGVGIKADDDWEDEGKEVPLDAGEIHSIYNWAKRMEKTGAVQLEEVEEEPDYLNDYDPDVDYESDLAYRITIYLGDDRNHEVPGDGATPSYIPVSKLNDVAYKILSSSPSESEERLYIKNPDYGVYVNIKDSLVGVLVPDVQYASKAAQAFRQLHPHLPMYIYYDKSAFGQRRNMWNEVLRLNPELKTLYKFPR